MNAEERIESYLDILAAHLSAVTPGERQEIVGEIAARIRSSAAEPDTSVELVLVRLGSPEILASRYQNARIIEKAGQSFWPPMLLRATFRAGAIGILLFLGAMVGYWLGGSMMVFGALAFAWSLFHSGPASATPGGSSVTGLGPIVLGGLIVLATTFVLRVSLRGFHRSKSPL